jgi:hypothetical protein
MPPVARNINVSWGIFMMERTGTFFWKFFLRMQDRIDGMVFQNLFFLASI